MRSEISTGVCREGVTVSATTGSFSKLEFDDLMDEYSAKTLKDIKEADLPEFVKKARKIVAKYYDEK